MESQTEDDHLQLDHAIGNFENKTPGKLRPLKRKNIFRFCSKMQTSKVVKGLYLSQTLVI